MFNGERRIVLRLKKLIKGRLKIKMRSTKVEMKGLQP